MNNYCRNNLYPNNDLRKKIEDYSYGLNDIIGKGYSSSVFKGVNEKTKQIVAIKVIDIKSLKDKIGKQMLESEIEALRKLNHNNILKCYDVYSTVNNCYIITEFCTQGDLENLMKKRERLTEAEAIPIMKDLFKGFYYLASKGYLHRDLKPANIFIRDSVYKIADFGFAKKDSGLNKKQQYNVGTPLYMSPEALRSNIYTVKNDIWSLGIIFYELIQGSTPWESKSEKELMDKLTRIPVNFTRSFSEDIKDFIRRCLVVDEERRINLAEMQAHPFIKRIMDEPYVEQYQSMPPLLYKINSNAENKEPVMELVKPLTKEQKRTVQEKAITAQIYFMRYLFKLSEMLTKGKLHFFVIKQLISTLEALKSSILDKKNTFSMDNWDQFLASEKSRKFSQVVIQYSKKYSKLYSELEEYVSKGTKDKRFSIYLDGNLQRTETLSLGSLYYSLEEIRDMYKYVRDNILLKDYQDELYLPDDQQKTALKLDFTITYYQLNCLSLDYWNDLDYFARTSKIEILTEQKPSLLQKMHIREIEHKLKDLEII